MSKLVSVVKINVTHAHRIWIIDYLFLKVESQIKDNIETLCQNDLQRTVVYIFAPLSEEFYSVYHTESRGQ